MNRYEMSVRRNNVPTENPAARFKVTSSITEIGTYIRHCIEHQKVFRAEDMPEGKLDAAVVMISKSTDVPILVDSADDVLALSTAYSHRAVYSRETLPRNVSLVMHYTKSLGEPLQGVRTRVIIVKGKRK